MRKENGQPGFSVSAARRCPSAISRAIAALEDDIGVRLFQRTTRRVSLTEAGELFFARISRALPILALCMAAVASPAHAAPATANTSSIDYADASMWLCRPGKRGACTGFQNVITVAPDGSVSPHFYEPNRQAKIDCFYVYPTSSADTTANSDLHPGGELLATAAQFGQFGAKCRQYAPLYRSVTLHGLRGALTGQAPGGDHDLAYRDLLNAWKHYLAHDNAGRGIVLIGHSQGSNLLIRPLQEEIDGKPIRERIVYAILPGSTVLVPQGKTVGGSFKTLPLCTGAGQFGCVIVYASYRATAPPSDNPPARYGRSKDNLDAACTNPAAPGSASKVPLDAYFPKGNTTWTSTEIIDAPFVRVPGLVSGQCVTRSGYHYLEITVTPDPADARTDDIPGDLLVSGEPLSAWGLHRVDIALTMGNLLDLVDDGSRAWLAAHP